MLLQNLREAISLSIPAANAILNTQRIPPDLRKRASNVNLVVHLFKFIHAIRESILARIPIPVTVKPTIVEREPMNSKLLHFGQNANYFGGLNVKFITPRTPCGAKSSGFGSGAFKPCKANASR